MPTITLTITNGGLDLLRDSLAGANNPRLAYFAVGNGTSTPVATQTQLDNEQFRKALTSFTNGAAHGELLASCYLAPPDAAGLDIEEVGIFAGSAATPAANTGVMLGRALYSHNPKSSAESIQLQLDIVL